MPVTAQEIQGITDQIWTSVLGLEIAPHDPGDAPEGATVTGLVQITGSWTGAVAIGLTYRLASRATAIMLGLPVNDTTAEDVWDAVGELANMTGGNVTSLVGEPARLSLPTVTAGIDYCIAIPGAVVRQQVRFRCGEGRIAVTVLQGNGSRPGATPRLHGGTFR